MVNSVRYWRFSTGDFFLKAAIIFISFIFIYIFGETGPGQASQIIIIRAECADPYELLPGKNKDLTYGCNINRQKDTKSQNHDMA